MKSRSIAEPRSHLGYVDGLRALAGLAVVWHHAWTRTGELGGATDLFPFSDAAGMGCAYAVQLFFVLSAFVLVRSSTRRFLEDRRPVASFFVRRAARIQPLWLLACVAYFLLAPPASGKWSALGASLTWTYGFSPVWLGALVPVGWSLFVEETFYLLHPLLMRLVTSARGAGYLLLATLGIQAAWRLYRHDHHSCFGGWETAFPLQQWPAFAAGTLLSFVPAQRARDEGPWSPLVDLCAVLFFAWSSCAGDGLTGTGWHGAVLGCCVLVFAAGREGSLLRCALEWAPLQRVGVGCYSIYLFHMLVMAPYVPLVASLKLPHELGALVLWGATVAITVPLSLLTFALLERPCVELGRRACARVNRTSPSRAEGVRLALTGDRAP